LDVEIACEAAHLAASTDERIVTDAPAIANKVQPVFRYLNDDAGSFRGKKVIAMFLS